VARLDARAGGRAGDHDAALVRRDDRVAERGAADDGGELELVAAGHEDPRDVVERRDQGGVVGLLAALRAHGHDVRSPLATEEGVVHLGDLGTQRRRGGDHRDPRLLTPAPGHELLQDGAPPQLVLGAADDHQGSLGHRSTLG
jgi:hypothetical protein